jgi:hypothetical protein
MDSAAITDGQRQYFAEPITRYGLTLFFVVFSPESWPKQLDATAHPAEAESRNSIEL